MRVVVYAVRREPVSGVIFPNIRENTGKFAKMKGFGYLKVENTVQR
jgi:hypothetical protein